MTYSDRSDGKLTNAAVSIIQLIGMGAYIDKHKGD